ncbi:MAG: hypothetical protein ACTHJ8_03405 [Mucilaginibacter sp.]
MLCSLTAIFIPSLSISNGVQSSAFAKVAIVEQGTKQEYDSRERFGRQMTFEWCGALFFENSNSMQIYVYEVGSYIVIKTFFETFLVKIINSIYLAID